MLLSYSYYLHQLNCHKKAIVSVRGRFWLFVMGKKLLFVDNKFWSMGNKLWVPNLPHTKNYNLKKVNK